MDLNRILLVWEMINITWKSSQLINAYFNKGNDYDYRVRIPFILFTHVFSKNYSICESLQFFIKIKTNISMFTDRSFVFWTDFYRGVDRWSFSLLSLCYPIYNVIKVSEQGKHLDAKPAYYIADYSDVLPNIFTIHGRFLFDLLLASCHIDVTYDICVIIFSHTHSRAQNSEC